MVSPPDGDLTRFMASLDKMEARPERIYYPGHGGPVADAHAMIRWQRAHRQSREGQIREALGHGPATVLDLTHAIYTDVDPRLIPAASRNVLAHLIDLLTRDLVTSETPITPTARFTLK